MPAGTVGNTLHAAALVAFAALARAGEPLEGERDLSLYTYEQYQREFPERMWSSVRMGLTDAIGTGDERRSIFQSNLEKMRAHNANPDKTWFAAPNEFSDWTNAEFRALRTTRPLGGSGLVERGATDGIPSLRQARGSSMSIAGLPESVDWRSKGVVTPVKDQGACGSCWSFSAAETLESFLAIADNSAPPVLSEQQLVSCMPNPEGCGGSGGCQGATQGLAFNYTTGAGLSLEADYPYRGSTGRCIPSDMRPYATNDGFVALKSNDYGELMNAVAAQGPIAIGLAAGSFSWQLYGGGILSADDCEYDVDHAVQLVGYGSEAGKPYWLVRNSWGKGWGEDGYIRIRRFGEGEEPCGVDGNPQAGFACRGDTAARTYCGVCGLLSSSTYPTGVRRVAPSFI